MDCELLTRAKEYRLKLLRRDSECDLLDAANGRGGPIDEFSSVEKMAHQYLQRNGGEEDYSDDEDDVITDDFSVSVLRIIDNRCMIFFLFTNYSFQIAS